MNVKLAIILIVFGIPLGGQGQDECKRCDCSYYPITDQICLKCCFTQKGIITSTSPDEILVTPTTPTNKLPPEQKKFKIRAKTKINATLRNGANATVYYHIVDGENVATEIDLTDYIEGQLKPGSEPMPPDNECSNGDYPQDAVRALFGSSGSVALGFPFVALSIDGAKIITLQRTKQGMLVSAKLYDSSGQLLAEIVDNHFFVNTKNSFRIDRPDPESLSVFSGNEQVLGFRFLNPYAIRVLGTLYGPEGTHLDVYKDEMKLNGRGHFSALCFGSAHTGLAIGTSTHP